MACSKKKIAQELFITLKVVKKHLANIRKQLGVKNTAEMLNITCNDKENSMEQVNLTPQGQKIFMLILKGYTSKAIAEELGLSFSSVRKHREKMLSMNNCSTTSDLILKYHSQK